MSCGVPEGKIKLTSRIWEGGIGEEGFESIELCFRITKETFRLDFTVPPAVGLLN
jgi:hypothetical protein